MCVAGMGNGSVGWLKVLTHLTLMPLTVMKRELCVCVSWQCDSPSGFGGLSCLLPVTENKCNQVCACVVQGEAIGCRDETSVSVTPCCCSLSSKGCRFSFREQHKTKERGKGRCRTTSALPMICQTHHNRSGVKTQVVLRVSWHHGWKPAKEFLVTSCQQKHRTYKWALW